MGTILNSNFNNFNSVSHASPHRRHDPRYSLRHLVSLQSIDECDGDATASCNRRNHCERSDDRLRDRDFETQDELGNSWSTGGNSLFTANNPPATSCRRHYAVCDFASLRCVLWIHHRTFHDSHVRSEAGRLATSSYTNDFLFAGIE